MELMDYVLPHGLSSMARNQEELLMFVVQQAYMVIFFLDKQTMLLLNVVF